MTPYEITPLHQFMADLYVAGMAIDVVTRLGYVFAESEYYSTHREVK